MPRYVDAEKELAEMKFAWAPQDMDTTNALGMYEDFLLHAPSEDVAPVIHAHWTITYESTAGVTDAKCSNCGFASLAYENDVHTDEDCNYCPRCGAIMDEEVDDG